ncbi:helix-turn-helix domain-containing protein [Scatolibacter rhodanostii]|uniref:helix-turn-helix domain-containing protein n=1 Tax=Scatolibacter rhodanostii TaxID=2014781 RepID=UPI000C0837C5|nr:helix-turn-helix transcriptional regulator [Scatolibacter rhodanostii]
MNTREAVQQRILSLCKEYQITPNALSYKAGVPQSTIKSILNNETQNVGIVTLKKICDGFGISLFTFFDTEVFRNLEQEIQ